MTVKLSVNETWLGLIQDLLIHGAEVRPRDKTTRELLAHTSRVPMTRALMTVKERGLGYRFAPAEAAWILSGDNRVATIKPFSKHISQFSDDGRFFMGAYGPPFIDQVSYAVDALYRDPSTRQALITLWRPRPGPSRDYPCTIALQWLWRDEALQCVATMRSSDAWLGWCYDVHSFSMMSAYVALALRERLRTTALDDRAAAGAAFRWAGAEIRLGDLYLTAGSQHLYKIDWADAERCLANPNEVNLAPAPLDLNRFTDPDDLVDQLWAVARRDGSEAAVRRGYLIELF